MTRQLDPLTQELSGMQLIEASAGTGKTYTITTLFLRLLLETPMDVSAILVVTFTEAAALELKERIRERMAAVLRAYRTGDCPDDLARHLFSKDAPAREKRLISALREYDAAEITTIHGFLNRVLGEHAFECGVPFDTELLADQQGLLDDIVYDFYAKETAGASPLLLSYLEETQKGPSQLASIVEMAPRLQGMTVLPAPVLSCDPAPAFEAAFAGARACVAAHGDDFELMLDEHPGLYRRVYNKARLPVWLAELRAYLASPQPTLPMPDGVRRFTRGALSEKSADPPTHAVVEAVDRLVAAEAGFEAAWVGMMRRFLSEARGAMDAIKAVQGVHTFDDLILRVDDALQGSGGEDLKRSIRQRLGAALIDEFQDTDPVQYRIFRKLFGDGAPFVMIGDPKQSIYGFRGADIFTYLEAARAVGDRRATLRTNWRSDPGLITAVNTLFDSAEAPFFFEDIGFAPVSPRAGVADRFAQGDGAAPLEVRFVPRPDVGSGKLMDKASADERLPAAVASDIAALLASSQETPDPIAPSRLAVLVATNREAAIMLSALDEAGVPGVLFSAASVFQSREATELLIIMTAVDEPGDASKLRTALATRVIGLDAAKIDALAESPAGLERCVARFAALRRIWDESGFIQMWSRLLDEESLGESPVPVGAAVLERRDGERMMTNLRHLAELLERRRADRQAGRRALIHWLTDRIATEGATPADAELRLESDAESVRIITVHKSKGLEFDVVYCPYLWKGLGGIGRGPLSFHHPEKNRAAYLDLGGPDRERHRRFVEEEAMAESLRLAYVALTRARHKTIVVHGAFRGMERSPLAYLLHHGGRRCGLAALAERVKGLDDDAILADIGALSARAGGAIRVTGFDTLAGGGALSGPRPPHRLRCRVLSRSLPRVRSTTSFTDLVRTDAPFPEAGIDRIFDERDPVDLGALAPQVSDPPPEAAAFQLPFGLTMPALPLLSSRPVRLPIVALERGARVGTMLHTVFEEVDFQDTEAAFKETVAAVIARYGMDLAWQEPIAEMVRAVVSTPLGPAPRFRLRDIAPDRRLNELGFLLPVGEGDGDSGLLTALGSAMAAHGAAVPDDYLESLSAAERSSGAEGFLKGFIDLVFVHEGRYYIVDYKSNYLGEGAADYGRAALTRAMAEHHYFIQYHLYSVALMRYLKHRLGSVGFDAAFGGVFYLFLRGMSGDPDLAEGGVFFDKPTAGLVAALSETLRERA